MLFSLKYVHRLKWNGFLQSLLWSSFGVLFMVLYPWKPHLMTLLGGIFLLIQGLPQLLLFMEEDERFLIAILSLLDAMLVSFLGVWMLSKPQEVHDTLPAVLAFVTFLHAISNLIITFRLRDLHFAHWHFAGMVTAAKLVATAILALQFHLHTESMVLITGICMLLDALSDIWMWKHLEECVLIEKGI